jgi:hypothetical protein
LLAWTCGDQAALEPLVALLETELRKMAWQHMSRERPDHTLQATALINEAYLRLVALKRVRWQSRAHFCAMASRIMRRILVGCGEETSQS